MKINTTGLILFEHSFNNTKGIASVCVNDEFLIKGIRIFEGANGPYAKMPAQYINGEYRDMVFPITARLREQISTSVIQTYNNMTLEGMTRLPTTAVKASEHSGASIFVTLERRSGKIKAAGKAVINKSIVISDIKVVDYTDKDGREIRFVAMPGTAAKDGGYRDVIQIISTSFAEKLNNAVMVAYAELQNTEFKGMSYDALRKTGDVKLITALSKPFVQKLTAELEEAGIAYSAAFNTNVRLYIRKEDEEMFNSVRMKLTKRLVAS